MSHRFNGGAWWQSEYAMKPWLRDTMRWLRHNLVLRPDAYAQKRRRHRARPNGRRRGQ